MEDKPYYEQEYHEPKTDIPRPTFGQAFKLLFTAPFKQNARSTRRGFCGQLFCQSFQQHVQLRHIQLMALLIKVMNSSY